MSLLSKLVNCFVKYTLDATKNLTKENISLKCDFSDKIELNPENTRYRWICYRWGSRPPIDPTVARSRCNLCKQKRAGNLILGIILQTSHGEPPLRISFMLLSNLVFCFFSGKMIKPTPKQPTKNLKGTKEHQNHDEKMQS